MSEDSDVVARVKALEYEISKTATMFAYDKSNVQVGATVVNVEITTRFKDYTYRSSTTLNIKI